MVVQWLKICLAIQGMQVGSLVRELRSRTPQSNSVHAPQLESQCSTTGILCMATKTRRSQVNNFFKKETNQ